MKRVDLRFELEETGALCTLLGAYPTGWITLVFHEDLHEAFVAITM